MTIEEKAREYVETCIDDDPVNPFAAIARIEEEMRLSEVHNGCLKKQSCG